MRISSPPASSASGTEIRALRPRPRRRPPAPSVIPRHRKHVFALFWDPVDELASYSHICLRADRGDIAKDDRLSKARGFCQPHVSRNNGVEHLRTEVLACLRRHLTGKIQSRI